MDEDLKKVKEMLSRNSVRLVGKNFTVIREKDGQGGTGEMYPMDRENWQKQGELGEIIVGLAMTVGFYGWTTTTVTEIMYVSEDKLRATVRTLNSVYSVQSVSD